MSVKKLKSLAKDSLIYGLSGIVTRMITVTLVPIYTRIFSPSDYGTLNLINTTFALVGMFSVFALDSSAGRWFYDTDDLFDRKTTFASWFWFQFAIAILFAVLLMAATPLAATHLLKLPLNDIWAIWLLPSVTLIANILPGIIWNWFRFNRKPVATVLFTLSQSLLTISLTLIFVVVLKWGLKGVFSALLISGTLFSLIALVQMRSWLSPVYFRINRLKEMLRFAFPLIPAAIAYWVLNTTDAYFIMWFKNKSEVGLFAIGSAVASGVGLITGAFQQAWGPFAFSIINEPDVRETYANVFYVFGVVSSILILGMFLFSPEALAILTSPKYYDAAWVASILSISIVLGAFSYIASIGTSIAKDNKPYATAIFVAAITTVILDIILIPFFGKEGSAIATVLAQVLVPCYIFYRAQKVYFVPYKFAPVILMLILAIVIGVLIRLITANFEFIYIIAMKTLTFIAYLFLLAYISKEYLEKVRQKFRIKRSS